MKNTAAVITVSDSCYNGTRRDTSGPCIRALLEEAGYDVVSTAVVPDEEADIREELRRCAGEGRTDLVLTTGGTGLSPRDVTPEATLSVVDREIRSIPQAMLYAGLSITPRAMLSRAVAGTLGRTLIVNLPGSEKAARENLLAVLDTLGHGLDMLRGRGHD
ncbi:molybdenum cofactor biosynthesis protein B [uncultured Oscillibacter sp.]|uniref:MogA/MoaB family molybdenum cofactor biosynthesis protein n=1 Tax=uncultured Oscillibacter sp. TaxID=876091 RepID=UPI0025D54A26|nr:MogA/MoaB family molybdenum cofactor biosynthesis protein [uncultured Oscillibacter sp.]